MGVVYRANDTKLERNVALKSYHLASAALLNMAVQSSFTPVLAKHTKSFNLIDSLGVGVERIQRNFEPSGGRQAKDSNQRRARKADMPVCGRKLEAPRTLVPAP